MFDIKKSFLLLRAPMAFAFHICSGYGGTLLIISISMQVFNQFLLALLGVCFCWRKEQVDQYLDPIPGSRPCTLVLFTESLSMHTAFQQDLITPMLIHFRELQMILSVLGTCLWASLPHGVQVQ